MSAASWILTAVAGSLSLLSPLIFRPILRKVGAFDIPNARSSHSKITLRGGGLSPLLGLGVTFVLIAMGFGLDGQGQQIAMIVMSGAIGISIIGLVDDLLAPKTNWVAVRAGVQLAAGLTISILIPMEAKPWWFVILSAAAFAAYVNFTNFMDGVNTISSLHGLIAGAAYGVTGAIVGLQWMATVSFALAAAFIAFLPWNVRKPGIFLGDVGSYLLGGMIASVGIAAVASDVPVIAVLAPVSIYMADTISTLVTRLTRKEPIFSAHRSHIYQQVEASGAGHLGASLLVSMLTVVVSFFGVLACLGDIEEIIAGIVIVIFMTGYIMLRPLLSYVNSMSRWAGAAIKTDLSCGDSNAESDI